MRLERERGIPIRNHSAPGAKVASALRKAREAALDDGVVLLEIGGNDLLGGTAAADFERDLDALLDHVSAPQRTVVMFELPLPPLRNEYGAIQRRLAAKHGAHLIPRRILIRVLTTTDATIDGIHLTPAGHALMARTVWEIIGPALEAERRPIDRRMVRAMLPCEADTHCLALFRQSPQPHGSMNPSGIAFAERNQRTQLA